MQTSALCQELLDYARAQLPDEHDAILGLAALLTFHPEETEFFITEVVILLMRNQVPLPQPLARKVSCTLFTPGVPT